jgi:hypothetical protein
MHKSILTFGLLASSLVMLSAMPLFNNNTALAQGYNTYGDSYSTYPTDDNKYECRTGPLEGFFVSSVEFCKHVKFDKERKDIRDNRTETQGPQGPQGPGTCEECFNSFRAGGSLTPELRDNLDHYLRTTPVVVGDHPPQIVGYVGGLCGLIHSDQGITRAQITNILMNAFQTPAPDIISAVIQCLQDQLLIK